MSEKSFINGILKKAGDIFQSIIPGRRTKKEKFRKVFFGLRIRFLALLFIFMTAIIFVLTVVMFLDQRRILQQEKNEKAGIFTQILGGPAEFYLDRDIKTTAQDLKVKYEIIVKEAANFKRYNNDIEQILLSDRNKKIVFSASSADVRTYSELPFIKDALSQKKESLTYYDFKIKKKNKKEERFRALTYPIFLHNGELVDVLADYKKYYLPYEASDKRRKNEIYRILWTKYKDKLGKDFEAVKNTGGKKAAKETTGQVVKAGDIDFLFLKVFSEVMKDRKERIQKADEVLLAGKWLESFKKDKIDAYKNDKATEAGDIQKKIMEAMSMLSQDLDDARLLGALSIIFNVNRMGEDIDKNVTTAMIIAGIILAFSIVVSFYVVNFMVRNLKKLEKWALEVSAGNIDNKVVIEQRDEIGRLSDIFNNMLDEIKMKFHLEKYVSQSTRSMIEQQKGREEFPVLGKTDKKNLAFIFSDVRGFTSFSEKNQPETVIEVLNLYFEIQARIINNKKGDIDDYVGDQIMAHFSGDKKADLVLSTAVEIMKEVQKFNEDRQKKNLPYFEIGIGVHGGDVVVGNIGSGFRMDFSCIGDAVNLASRLCSAAAPGEILVSKALFSQARQFYRTQKVEPIEVKGKEKKIDIVRVLF